MKISDYQSRWHKEELNRFQLANFDGLSIDDRTIDFLLTIGLPYSAAPFVSFDRKALKTINQIYSTGNSANNFLVDIGSDDAGNPICIDMKTNSEIVALDHENNFTPRFVNTSIYELFAFLTIFKDFAEKLNRLRGDFAFIDSDFTDEELEEFVEKLKSVDSRALESNDTFWSREIETLKANRAG